MYPGGASLVREPRELSLQLPATMRGGAPRLRPVGDVHRDGCEDLSVQVDCGWPAWLEVFRAGPTVLRRRMRGITWGCGYRE
jgi:hypothetical protein